MGVIGGRWFRLLDYSQQEREIAKGFIIEAVKSAVEMSADDIVGDVFGELEDTVFHGDDTITIEFKIDTIGNDIITAIGAARRKLTK
jgi:hypothetical protein